MFARSALLMVTIVLNIALWISYFVMKVRPRDFGRVPAALHVYLLVAAGIAYVANLAFVGLLSASQTADASTLWVATACIALYYGLQLAFLPLTRAAIEGKAPRTLVQALLVACVVPMTVLAGIGVRLKSDALSALGLISALHVLVNDAVVFGFLF